MTAMSAPGGSGDPQRYGRSGTATPTRSLVVVRPAPHREPPFDDESEHLPVVTRYDQHLPFARATPAPAAAIVARRSAPDPATWGRRLMIALIETAGGRRPLHQLAGLLGFGVVRGLGAELERAARTGRPHWLRGASVHTVRATEPADCVAELCATVETTERLRAVAMRLERESAHSHWRCVLLQLG